MSSSSPVHGPVRLDDQAYAALRPVSAARVLGGLWAERRRINREVSVPGAWQRLVDAGNIANLELAARVTAGESVDAASMVNDLPFLDSDLHKWLEAIGWTLADPDLDPDTAAELRQRLTATPSCSRAPRPATATSTRTSRCASPVSGSSSFPGAMSSTAQAT